MITTQPDDLTFAAELRQLLFEIEVQKIAAARRMWRNAAWMHPDAREPDDYEPEEDDATE